MSGEDTPDQGPVTDPQELERVMMLALKDPGLMRMLVEAGLWVYVPPHPELVGEHVRYMRDGLTWNTYWDQEGDFAAVFTSLRAMQDERRSGLRKQREKPGMVELPGGRLFGFMNNECHSGQT